MLPFSRYLVYIPLISLASCDVIGGIFKAGVWTGLLLVALVVGIVLWIVARMRR